MSCLPWVGRELYEKKEQALEMLLVNIEVYLNKRAKKHHPALRVWASDTPHPQEEVSIPIVYFIFFIVKYFIFIIYVLFMCLFSKMF